MHRNPGSDDLKAMALEEPEVRKTKYGSIFADSEPMSRAAKMTRNNVDSRFGDAERALLEQAQRRWPARNWWPIDVDVGDGSRGDHRPADRAAAVRPRGLRRAEALPAHG